MNAVRVGLLGCGVVGTEVVRQLQTHADDLAARIGAPLELVGIAVRREHKPRDLDVDPALFTTDAMSLVARDLDVVIEVIGGIEPARTLILSDTGDYRVPITQSFQLYHALADNGVATQFIAYPVSGHSPADPVHSRDVDRRWIAWLEKYLAQ